jgi:uncharacterized protein with von Willebrand factor type A (vWA) domain
MRFVYSEWNEALAQMIRGLRDLMSIFNLLLLQTNGDVDLTLDIMRQLRRLGMISEDLDFDEFERKLREENIITARAGTSKLTGKGEKRIRQDAFEQIFEQLKDSRHGDHAVHEQGGASEEILPEKRPFRFGDNLTNIDFKQSLLNSVSRTASFGLDMSESDLEVFDSELTTTCATVLMIDISHSMILYGEDRITPAKRIALALSELILTKYPKDSLNVVVFGDDAKEVRVRDIPYISVGPYHTNTKAGLEMARRILLRRKDVNKQVFMITDGKPSMIVRSNGSVYKNPYGLDPVIVNRTLDQAVICRKKRITITTFMISDDPYLQNFVQKMTELNRGRAYFSSVQDLGNYVLWDFVNRRRKG